MTTFNSTAVPLPIENVDTDQIIPARFLKAISREGFGDNLFRDWRYETDNQPKPDFVLNNPTYKGKILVAGKNFGCGSSREHAAWSIKDYGFDVVISSFFADIFKGNALNNLILPITVSESELQRIFKGIYEDSDLDFAIDIPNQKLNIPAISINTSFDISAYKKECLINGYDDIDYILSRSADIDSFEKNSAISY